MQYSRDKAVYFSSRFYTSIAGAGTADRNLMRLTVSRCETDLGNIKIAYQSLYGMSLSTAVTVCCLAKYSELTKESLHKEIETHFFFKGRYIRILSIGFTGAN